MSQRSTTARVLSLPPRDRPSREGVPSNACPDDRALRRRNLVRSLSGKAAALISELQAQVYRLARENAKLRRLRDLAFHDALTGLPNRRYFEERFAQEIARTQRVKTALSVAVLDLDDLKLINDGHGHSAGDRALCRIARFLQKHLRGSDFACRYGGDEFVILMPDTTAEGATRALVRLQAAWESFRKNPPDGAKLTSAFSFGVADSVCAAGSDAKELLNAADAAMYGAKARRKTCARRAPALARRTG